MQESSINDYFIEEESGHPGYWVVRFIGTPRALANWISQMNEHLSSSIADARAIHNDRGERLIFRTTATKFDDPKKLIVVSFYVAKDLDYHHVQPTKRNEFFDRYGCYLLMPIIILALIGWVVLQGGFRPW